MKNVPVVAHLIYRLDFGGLETLLVENINRMPADAYHHVIICLTDYNDTFAKKISKPFVDIFALHKSPGLGLKTHAALWKLLRRLRPAILHTYNLSAIEYALTATIAGVPIRIHAEHGRDAHDPEGRNRKHNLLRRLLIPFIDCYVPVSGDLQRWLATVIGVPDSKNRLINNGVDTEHFKPADVEVADKPAKAVQEAYFPAGCFVIGTVGRLQDVKDHQGLIATFIQLRQLLPTPPMPLRLAIIGNGPLMPVIKRQIDHAGIADLVWLPGARSDIAELMRGFSVFVLPSIAEGTPVTILEAMSTALPVVATRVGGVPEVVLDNVTGLLVPASNPQALATAIASYCEQPELAARHGAAGRRHIEQHYSMGAMLAAYTALYDTLRKTKLRESIEPCAE